MALRRGVKVLQCNLKVMETVTQDNSAYLYAAVAIAADADAA